MKAKITYQDSSAGHVPLASKKPSSGQIQGKSETVKLACYHELVERWVELGTEGNFVQRGREFKNRKSAAAIVEKTKTGLDHMIEEGRVAAIKVGVTMWIHIPTTSALIQRRERWDWNTCPRCPKTV